MEIKANRAILLMEKTQHTLLEICH